MRKNGLKIRQEFLDTKEGRQQYRKELAKEEQEPQWKNNPEYTPEFAALLKDTATTKILVYVRDELVGAVQSMTIHETRSTQDGLINVTIETARIRFSPTKITEAFEKGIISSTTQKLPLQLVIEENNQEMTRITNAWIRPPPHNPQMYVYSTTDWMIADEIEFEAESITSPQHFSTNDLLPVNGRGI